MIEVHEMDIHLRLHKVDATYTLYYKLQLHYSNNKKHKNLC
jgi:hypothetical protein